MRKYDLCFFIAGFVLAARAFAARTPNAVVGNQTIQLPVPEGFVDWRQSSPTLQEFAERFTPGSQRLLAAFFPPDIAEAYRSNKTTSLSRYFFVQTLRSIELYDVTPEIFSELKLQERQKIQESLDVNQIVTPSELAYSEGGRTTVNAVALGIYEETENSVSSLMMLNIPIFRSGRKSTELILVSNSTIRRNSKIIYLYVFSKFRGIEDAVWLQGQSKDYIARMQRE